jgi:hypothetical protein
MVVIETADGRRAVVELCVWRSADASLEATLNAGLGPDSPDRILEAVQHAEDPSWARAMRAVDLFGARIIEGHLVVWFPDALVDG